VGTVEYHKTSDTRPWFLSVPIILTPGLYPGPGVNAGPIFCLKFYGTGKWAGDGQLDIVFRL